MKTCEDMTRDVLDRVHAYQKGQAKRRAALRIAVTAVAACLVLAVGVVALWRFRPVDVLEGDATATSSVLPRGGENVYSGGGSYAGEDVYGTIFNPPDTVPFEINGVTYWNFPYLSTTVADRLDSYTLTTCLGFTVIRKAWTVTLPDDYLLENAAAYATAEDDDVVIVLVQREGAASPTRLPLFRDGAPCLIYSFDHACALSYVPENGSVKRENQLKRNCAGYYPDKTVYRMVVCWCQDGRQITDGAALRQKYDDLVTLDFAPVLERFGDRFVLSVYASFKEINTLNAGKNESYDLFLYGEYFHFTSVDSATQPDEVICSNKAKNVAATAVSYYDVPTSYTPIHQFTSANREIIDFYYQELCEKFPDYTRIPATSLWADFARLPDGNFVVGFYFNLRGGYHAGCVREYHSEQCEWRCSDTGFSAYFEKGFTREEITNIRAAQIAQIQERLAKDKLKVREECGAVEEQMEGVEWAQSGGKLYAQTWLIAYPAGSSYAEEDRVCIEARVELGDTTVESAVYNVPGTPPRAEWLTVESGTVSSAAAG